MQIKTLLSQGVDVDLRADDYSTPLQRALFANEFAAAGALLAAGANLQSEDRLGRTIEQSLEHTAAQEGESPFERERAKAALAWLRARRP